MLNTGIELLWFRFSWQIKNFHFVKHLEIKCWYFSYNYCQETFPGGNRAGCHWKGLKRHFCICLASRDSPFATSVLIGNKNTLEQTETNNLCYRHPLPFRTGQRTVWGDTATNELSAISLSFLLYLLKFVCSMLFVEL